MFELEPVDYMAINKRQALRRTKLLLVSEWNLGEEPLSDTSLRDHSDGLGKNDEQIDALENPVNVEFHDVLGANRVLGSELRKATTVGKLRDKIWAQIPQVNRIP